jgi:ABC-type lipoprotein release transport system permease subunit
MKETKSPKRSSRVAQADEAELVFVVDVSSLTKKGFVGTTTYHGKQVDLEFDDGGAGIFLTSEMAGRLHVRKGSTLSVIMENERSMIAKATVAGVGSALRISDPKIYYAVGREGGAIVRIRKG